MGAKDKSTVQRTLGRSQPRDLTNPSIYGLLASASFPVAHLQQANVS